MARRTGRTTKRHLHGVEAPLAYVTVERNPSGSERRLQLKARANFLKMVEYIRNVAVSLHCQKSSVRVRFFISNKSAQAQFLSSAPFFQSISRAAVLRGPVSKPRVNPFQVREVRVLRNN
ncbi:hypothetical protein DEO72_LG2g2034 [Vigna unguiculata]|uniref:Uncharacterized protein n=1 Tax=Vigna unguiculata TaxID=3917 RepID=A0A4D6L0X5_VIGUN|nr:hypothetical protein DEO72_LG2g2034 [Vigna unguiculata]